LIDVSHRDHAGTSAGNSVGSLGKKTKVGPEMDKPNGKPAAYSTNPNNGPFAERRQAERYTLRDARGRLSWSEGSERVTCEMMVINISGGGAAMLADRAPPAGQTVWLSMQKSIAGMESLEAHLVATSADPSGKHLVRVRFTSWVSLDAILEQHRERRTWQRYPARETRATLSWYDQDVQRTIRGELLNISGGGAAVITELDEIDPPAHKRLWLGLGQDASLINSIEAKLVVISLDPSGTKVVRLRFVDSCPMELFELAIQ
jgi:c-di-GMP-binding flagellar brake protein YcgR